MFVLLEEESKTPKISNKCSTLTSSLHSPTSLKRDNLQVFSLCVSLRNFMRSYFCTHKRDAFHHIFSALFVLVKLDSCFLQKQSHVNVRPYENKNTNYTKLYIKLIFVSLVWTIVYKTIICVRCILKYFLPQNIPHFFSSTTCLKKTYKKENMDANITMLIKMFSLFAV